MNENKIIATGASIGAMIFENKVDGAFVVAPTTPSTQATGTGAFDYNVNILDGLYVVCGEIKQQDLVANYDVDHGSTGNAILIVGESVVYSLVVFLNSFDGIVYLKALRGTIAVTANVLPLTDAEIEAMLGVDTQWFRLADCQVNRPSDTACTQTYNNKVRPIGQPIVT
jgi:hypothetical protein